MCRVSAVLLLEDLRPVCCVCEDRIEDTDRRRRQTDTLNGEALDSPRDVCGYCALEFHECEHCGATIHEESESPSVQVRGESREEDWCRDCADSHAFICDSCCELCDYEHSHYLGNSGCRICGQCYERDYFHCEQCGEVRHNDSYCGDGLCDECYSDGDTWRAGTCGAVPACDSFDSLASRRAFGIEIECCTVDSARMRRDTKTCWACKEDGSLPREGREFVSPPLRGDAGLKSMRYAVRSISKHDGSADDECCGTHIHVDMSDLTPEEFMRACGFIAEFEGIFFDCCASHRDGNCYCLPLHQPIADIRRNGLAGEFSRYRWMNTHSFSKHGTVEFRCFEGSLDAGKLEAWIRLCLYVVDRACGCWPVWMGLDAEMALLPRMVRDMFFA